MTIIISHIDFILPLSIFTLSNLKIVMADGFLLECTDVIECNLPQCVGILLKEWKGVGSNTIAVLVLGMLILIVSLIIPNLMQLSKKPTCF